MTNAAYYFLVCDIETSTLRDDDGTPVLTWLSYGYCILYNTDFMKIDICYFRQWDELSKFLNKIQMRFPNRRLTCFVHNLSFEFEFFIRNIAPPETILSNSTHAPIAARLQGFPQIDFRCTFKLTGQSLRKIGKAIGLEKLEDDYSMLLPSDEVSETKKRYCIRDCDVVAKYVCDSLLKEFGSLRRIPYTKTGRVRMMYKQFYKEYKENNPDFDWDLYPPEDCYEAMTNAFPGATVISSPLFTGVVLKDVQSLDETSAYPYNQLKEDFPYCNRNAETFDKTRLKEKFWIAKLRFTNIKTKYIWGWLSISKMNAYDELNSEFFNGKLIHAGYIERTITNVDYEMILQTYDFDDVEIIEFYEMTKWGQIPEPYQRTIVYYAELKGKMKAKVKEIEDTYGIESQEYIEAHLEYMNIKGDFNSIFGMTVQKLIQEEYYIDDLYVWNKKGVRYQQKKGHLGRNFLFGIYVTAYARRNLLRCIIKNCPNTFVYGDTDSVKGFFKNGFVDTNEKLSEEYLSNKYTAQLGEFDSEGYYDTFITWGAKKYAFTKGNDHIHFTVAGLPKVNTEKDKYKPPECEYQGKNKQILTLAEFKPGCIFRKCKLGHKFLTSQYTFDIDEETRQAINISNIEWVGKFIEEHNIHTNGGVALYDVDYSLNITKNDRKIIDKHHEMLPILAKKWGIENNIVEVI